MSICFEIREDKELAVWQGLGGAITEATAYNFSKLGKTKQKELLKAYYGKDGLAYNWCRLSIGSNDFCLKSFEYTKKRDLSDFSIEHDKKWVLPMVQEALKYNEDLIFLAAPWSPPSFMKFTHALRFGGHLKFWRYARYVEYLCKWIKAYEKEGVNIKYLSPQNEPRARQIWESCVYGYRAQRRLAYKYLAKSLDKFDTKLLLWDHNKQELSKVADRLLDLNEPKIAGICYHWYTGTFEDEMWQAYKEHRNKMFVSSEMCCGYSVYDEKSWQKDANLYIGELFSDINCGASAFIDWNMLLDWQGGPTYCRNHVKSPVILNKAEDDFILTPIYKALLEFSKLFPVGSQAVRCERMGEENTHYKASLLHPHRPEDVVMIAKKDKNKITAIAANVSDKEQVVTISYAGKIYKEELKPNQIKEISF